MHKGGARSTYGQASSWAMEPDYSGGADWAWNGGGMKGKGGGGGYGKGKGVDYGFAAGYGVVSHKGGARSTYGQASSWAMEPDYSGSDYGYMAAGKGGKSKKGWGDGADEWGIEPDYSESGDGYMTAKGGKSKASAKGGARSTYGQSPGGPPDGWGEIAASAKGGKSKGGPPDGWGEAVEKPVKKLEQSPADLYWDGHVEGFEETISAALAPHLHLDKSLVPEEVEKKICQYITRQAKRYTKDERTCHRPMPAQAAVLAEEFVHSAMRAVATGLWDKPWFEEVDFRDALHMAALSTFKSRKLFARTLPSVLNSYVDTALFTWQDDVRIEKAMRESVEATGLPDNYHKKAINHLTKSHEDAQVAAQKIVMKPNAGISQEQCMMQDFVTEWMRGFVGKSWDILENGVRGGTEQHLDFVTALFHGLTNPDRCCIPHEYASADEDSLPPKDWVHVTEMAQTIFDEMEAEAGRPTKKMKKALDSQAYYGFAPKGKGAKGGGRPTSSSEEQSSSNAFGAAEKHPKCTNDMACIGNLQCPLVRHLMEDGTPGDVYCQMCWDAVVEVRPTLLCEFVEA